MNTEEKPLLSFFVIAYNQSAYIREAIQGAISQTYYPLEIIISDDCSTDHTYEIIKQFADGYEGPHKLIINRTPRNLGIGGHINSVMELAKGTLIIASAGDDVSLPERSTRIYEEWRLSDRKAYSIFSSSILINSNGEEYGYQKLNEFKPEDFKTEKMINKEFGVYGCSHAWHRDVFDKFGPMLLPLICEDRVIPFRSALLGDIRYIQEPLVKHRRHERNTFHYSGEDVSSVSHLIQHRKRWSIEKYCIYKNWLKDLKSAENGDKILDFYSRQIEQRKKISEVDVALFDASYQERIKIIMHSICGGTSIRKLRERIGLHIMPKIYQKYLKAKYKFEGLTKSKDI